MITATNLWFISIYLKEKTYHNIFIKTWRNCIKANKSNKKMSKLLTLKKINNDKKKVWKAEKFNDKGLCVGAKDGNWFLYNKTNSTKILEKKLYELFPIVKIPKVTKSNYPIFISCYVLLRQMMLNNCHYMPFKRHVKL